MKKVINSSIFTKNTLSLFHVQSMYYYNEKESKLATTNFGQNEIFFFLQFKKNYLLQMSQYTSRGNYKIILCEEVKVKRFAFSFNPPSAPRVGIVEVRPTLCFGIFECALKACKPFCVRVA